MEQKLDAYLEQNRMYHFEGERGVRDMEKIMKEVCGYNDPWGSTMQQFFTDNSGAIQAVVEWIREARVTEWSDNLTELVGESIEEDEEEFED